MSAALSQFCGWAWNTSLHAAPLVLLVLASLWLFRGWLSPRWRYGLSLLILVRLLMPVTPESALSLWNLAPAPAETAALGDENVPGTREADAPAPYGLSSVGAWKPDSHEVPPTVTAASNWVPIEGEGALAAPQAGAAVPSTTGLLLGVWLAGVIALLGSSALRHTLLLRWVRRNAFPAGSELRALFVRCGGAKVELLGACRS